MSEYILTRQEEIALEIMEAIKCVWGKHGGDEKAVLSIGVNGPEIIYAIVEVLEKKGVE